jgi:integrase
MSTARAQRTRAQRIVRFDLDRLEEAKQELLQHRRAPNTDKAYAAQWGAFAGWCGEHRRKALPAAPETVSLWVAWAVYEREPRYRLNTVRLALSAIRGQHLRAGHPSPVTAEVKELVRSAARKLKEKRRCKAALTPEQLRELSRQLSDGGSVREVRDRALLLLTFASGWRSGEVSSLDLADVRVTAKGLALSLGASKTDQDGRAGRAIGIPPGARRLTCPVRALREWLRVRGQQPGPLFVRLRRAGGQRAYTVTRQRLSSRAIGTQLKQALTSIGVDPADYGAHSLRAGMATAAVEAGASEIAIMQRGGWRSIATVLQYVRPAKAFRGDPLQGVL